MGPWDSEKPGRGPTDEVGWLGGKVEACWPVPEQGSNDEIVPTFERERDHEMKIENISGWTLTIAAQDITQFFGVQVKQVIGTTTTIGTLNGALNGANTTTIFIKCRCNFVKNVDVVIGTGATAVTVEHKHISKMVKDIPCVQTEGCRVHDGNCPVSENCDGVSKRGTDSKFVIGPDAHGKIPGSRYTRDCNKDATGKIIATITWKPETCRAYDHFPSVLRNDSCIPRPKLWWDNSDPGESCRFRQGRRKYEQCLRKDRTASWSEGEQALTLRAVSFVQIGAGPWVQKDPDFNIW